MSSRGQPSWDDPQWKERDKPWAAGCRWLQSWWRQNQLGLAPGEIDDAHLDRKVASMIPLGTSTATNFLTAEIFRAVNARLAEGGHSGLITKDRLFRNLLSSQPTCFNLFGPFVNHPNALLDWVGTVDPGATRVDAVRFEWGPDRTKHFGGGSAFDAFVEYTATGRRFIGVECKYAEDLDSSSITVREPYRVFTDACGHWRDGATGRLERPRTRQLWLNTLLAQSLVDREDRYERGTVVMVACGADRSAHEATGLVRAELHAADEWLRWASYEDILATVRGDEEWAAAFRRRYLDFTPVRHLLRDDDPRMVDPATVDVEAINRLLWMGQRVTGQGSVLEQIVEALGDGRLTGANPADIEALNARASELAEGLKRWRQDAYAVWRHIENDPNREPAS